MRRDLQSLKAQTGIAEVLDNVRISHKRGRCARPSHGGSNPTFFSFNDEGFYCFSCGARGDVITLVESLHGVDLKGAVEFIASKWRITMTEDSSRCAHKSVRSARRVRREPLVVVQLKDRFGFLNRIAVIFTDSVFSHCRLLERVRLSLSEFYALEQKLDLRLFEIDIKLA